MRVTISKKMIFSKAFDLFLTLSETCTELKSFYLNRLDLPDDYRLNHHDYSLEESEEIERKFIGHDRNLGRDLKRGSLQYTSCYGNWFRLELLPDGLRLHCNCSRGFLQNHPSKLVESLGLDSTWEVEFIESLSPYPFYQRGYGEKSDLVSDCRDQYSKIVSDYWIKVRENEAAELEKVCSLFFAGKRLLSMYERSLFKRIPSPPIIRGKEFFISSKGTLACR